MENDDNVFDSDHHGERPQDNGQNSDEVIVGGFRGES
jgi:hypothetical protein